MLSRRVFGFHSYINTVHFLKVKCCQLPQQCFAMSNIHDDTINPPHDGEGDFFGITESDLFNKNQTFLSNDSSLNETGSSKEELLSKHLSKNLQLNVEKYVNTKFGKIRFDWQNTVPSKVESISSPKIKQSQETARGPEQSGGEMDYFSEMYFQQSLNEKSQTSTIVDNNANSVKSADINPKIILEEDMEYINSQYFGNYGENVENPNLFGTVYLEAENSTYDHFQSSSLKNNPSTSEEFTHDANFIESHYFPRTSDKSDSYETNLSGATENNLDFSEENPRARASTPETPQRVERQDSTTKHSFTHAPKYQNAFEASQEIRREIKRKKEGPQVDSKGFRILKDQVNDLSQLTTYEIANHLKSRIIYNKNDLIVINKPYGLSSHGGPGIHVNIANSLSELAKKIHHSGEIHLVHRLDKETTGIMLLAKTDKMASLLKNMFKERQVIKTYWALTKGIPNPPKGIIDIPIAEGTVDGKHRMVLKPEYNKHMPSMKKSRVKSQDAITHYEVINASCNCALVECKTETGVKHQVRVHLAFGLNTPILGDHKYSHLNKMAPQRLFPEILERLHIRQSKVRHVPMHLHALSIVLPEIINGKNLSFKAPLPFSFSKNMKSLKFRKSDKFYSK